MIVFLELVTCEWISVRVSVLSLQSSNRARREALLAGYYKRRDDWLRTLLLQCQVGLSQLNTSNALCCCLLVCLFMSFVSMVQAIPLLIVPQEHNTHLGIRRLENLFEKSHSHPFFIKMALSGWYSTHIPGHISGSYGTVWPILCDFNYCLGRSGATSHSGPHFPWSFQELYRLESRVFVSPRPLIFCSLVIGNCELIIDSEIPKRSWMRRAGIPSVCFFTFKNFSAMVQAQNWTWSNPSYVSGFY